jgi:hypothetical protein
MDLVPLGEKVTRSFNVWRNELRPFLFEDLPDRPLGPPEWAIVALANKTARIAWAVVARKEDYMAAA